VVRKALPGDAVLVEIARFGVLDFQAKDRLKAWQPPHYAAWVIPAAGRGEVQVIDLDEAKPIEDAVAAARKALQPELDLLRSRGEPDAEQQLRKPLQELARLVLQPLLPHIGQTKRWLISPDAALWLVPWAALPLPAGRYAIEAHPIHYLVTGRDLVNKTAVKATGPPTAMADPDYDLDPETARTASRRVPRQAEGEPSRELLALRGSSRSLTRAVFPRLPGGLPENPLLRCGLVLAGANQRQRASGPEDEDGILTGMEIVGTDLRGTELVVLSACETGLGDVRNGEGVAGLRQAFQLAGAQSVLATLWQVPDRDSARLMITFFDNLAAGQSRPAALRNAQLALIKSRRERNGAAHPFFWAAFTFTGDPGESWWSESDESAPPSQLASLSLSPGSGFTDSGQRTRGMDLSGGGEQARSADESAVQQSKETPPVSPAANQTSPVLIGILASLAALLIAACWWWAFRRRASTEPENPSIAVKNAVPEKAEEVKEKAESMIRLKCDSCGARLTASSSRANHRLKCPRCGNVVAMARPQ